jgi:hypothetical protein
MKWNSILAQLVSQSQVDEAFTRAVLWTLFSIVMLGIAIWRIVASIKRRKPPVD